MNEVISLRILSLVGSGMCVIDACKQVLGAENIDRMIGDLYDQLRTKA